MEAVVRMNVFVLNAGRCGSTTFIQACKHINNYRSGHETLITQLHHERLAYPVNHIEADNRLSWFLGRLDQQYGNDAFYVHLTRNNDDTIDSFSKRMDFGIMKAYREGILMSDSPVTNNEAIASDYLQTVTGNINLFLKDKNKKMQFRLENAQSDFADFFNNINAEGELQLAMNEWKTAHNSSQIKA